MLRDILRRSAGLETASFSVGNTSLAEFLGLGPTTSGQTVNEASAFGLSAVWRSVSFIAGTIGSLPLKTYRRTEDDGREQVASFLDDPGAPIGLTPMVWMETVASHLVLHGNAYLLHLRDGVGRTVGLQPIHPRAVTVEEDTNAPGRRRYTIQVGEGRGGARTLVVTMMDLTHIMGLSTDGLVGVSPLRSLRNALGAGLAGDEAAARQFRSGLLLGGLVSSDLTLDETQAKQVKEAFESKMGGAKHAGEVLVTNATLKFSPWQQTAEDAQFIESRQHQIEEIARMFGVPREMLSASGASSWGSGIQELVRGFQKFTLAPLTSRIEAALSRLLPNARFVEFDFAGLLQPSQEDATKNMAREIDAGVLTINEARRKQNRPPVEGGDVPTPGRFREVLE